MNQQRINEIKRQAMTGAVGPIEALELIQEVERLRAIVGDRLAWDFQQAQRERAIQALENHTRKGAR